MERLKKFSKFYFSYNKGWTPRKRGVLFLQRVEPHRLLKFFVILVWRGSNAFQWRRWSRSRFEAGRIESRWRIRWAAAIRCPPSFNLCAWRKIFARSLWRAIFASDRRRRARIESRLFFLSFSGRWKCSCETVSSPTVRHGPQYLSAKGFGFFIFQNASERPICWDMHFSTLFLPHVSEGWCLDPTKFSADF